MHIMVTPPARWRGSWPQFLAASLAIVGTSGSVHYAHVVRFNYANDTLPGGKSCLPDPEDLLMAWLSACYMNWYLHLASRARIVGHRCTDDPIGVGEVHPAGSVQFVRAIPLPENRHRQGHGALDVRRLSCGATIRVRSASIRMRTD
jgi:hypothetical protein